jgi:hypothetical protein
MALPIASKRVIREWMSIMTTDTARKYQITSPEDQRKFDRWLDSNAVLSSIFAIGMLTMALAAIIVPYVKHMDVAAVVSTSMSGE